MSVPAVFWAKHMYVPVSSGAADLIRSVPSSKTSNPAKNKNVCNILNLHKDPAFQMVWSHNSWTEAVTYLFIYFTAINNTLLFLFSLAKNHSKHAYGTERNERTMQWIYNKKKQKHLQNFIQTSAGANGSVALLPSNGGVWIAHSSAGKVNRCALVHGHTHRSVLQDFRRN